QNKEVMGRGVEDISVRTRRWHGLDHFECLGVEKSRRIAGDQTSMVFRINRHSMPGGICQRAREFVGIEVEYTDCIAASDVNTAVTTVRCDVVDSSSGRNLRCGKNLVRLHCPIVGRSDKGETKKNREAERGRKQCAGFLG